MKLNRLLCTGVCGAVLLAGLSACAPEAPQADPDDIAYQAAGISRDTVLFTVDGTEVTADEYLFWLLQSVAAAKQSGYLADDNAWEEEINGTPTAEYLREDALNTSILYTTVANHAAAEGITLSQEDEDAMDTFNLARMDADDDRHRAFSEEAEFQDSGFDIEDAPEDAGADVDVDVDYDE